MNRTTKGIMPENKMVKLCARLYHTVLAQKPTIDQIKEGQDHGFYSPINGFLSDLANSVSNAIKESCNFSAQRELKNHL